APKIFRPIPAPHACSAPSHIWNGTDRCGGHGWSRRNFGPALWVRLHGACSLEPAPWGLLPGACSLGPAPWGLVLGAFLSRLELIATCEVALLRGRAGCQIEPEY